MAPVQAPASPITRRRLAGLLGFLKKWTIPVVAGVTPVGLMVINIAYFLVKHLEQFRWAIAVMAFLSGMMLNTYVGLNIYRFVQRRFPDFTLVQQRNEELMVALGMGVITVLTFVLAYFTYQGLTADQLPGGFTFIYGTFQIASAVVIKVFFDRDRERFSTRRKDGGPARGAQPARSQPPTPGAPPTYLPPS